MIFLVDSKIEFIFFSPNTFTTLVLIFKNIIHAKHSATTGKNIAAQANIPKAPTPDFNNFMHA